MTTSYYPGHMAKARRQLRELLPVLDVGAVLLDARVPRASLGLNLGELLGNRPVIYALNKADLADPSATAAWVKHLGAAVVLEVPTGRGVGELLAAAADAGRGRRKYERPVRLAILGIPNVGKSSLLNRIAGRRAAQVGDKPGVTRARQWVRARPDLEILDTPGLLAPRLKDRHTALLLSLVGTIKEEIMGVEELAREALGLIEGIYPGRLGERYGVEITGDPDLDLASIGRVRGLLLPGGRVDFDRTARMLLGELRGGRLGRLTLEVPANP